MTQRVALKVNRDRLVDDYSSITSIDGKHPWQTEVPGAHVLYRARKRKNGKVAWFNFDLAKNMGLIDQNHPDELNPQLERTLLDTFAIQIINEYDILNATKIDAQDMKPNFYMATRYLQLQHPGRTGVTSGDGRSIWNGQWKGRGKTWDVSSCGTGATCLSPATHKYQKFFRTGDPAISYGCGYSDLDDGIMGAMFSEILHRNGHETERCLAVIEFPGNLSINVRAGQNLLRPSHFFNHLKQGNLVRLKATIDFFIKREVANKAWPAIKQGENSYKLMLSHISKTFAEMAARFESDYIFCWLAWDGDNILANGGIIDYGSIRQFGLFHYEYRFDDVDRWSTNLLEQKEQARYLVQTFAQIENYLNTGKKRPLGSFRNHPELKRFDRLFKEEKTRKLLAKTGYLPQEVQHLITRQPKLVERYQKAFSWFERKTKETGKPYRVADGLTRDALYCMRDILRELPKYFEKHNVGMDAGHFMKTIASSYCTKKDARVTLVRKKWLTRFQTAWLELAETTAKASSTANVPAVFHKLNERSAILNRYERVTGDAICNVGEKLIRGRKDLTRKESNRIMTQFIEEQVLVPEAKRTKPTLEIPGSNRADKLIRAMLKTVKSMREGL